MYGTGLAVSFYRTRAEVQEDSELKPEHDL